MKTEKDGELTSSLPDTPDFTKKKLGGADLDHLREKRVDHFWSGIQYSR